MISFKESFMAKIEEDPIRGCWNWIAGQVGRSGYGAFRKSRAHRVAYEMFRGPIPTGLEIDHLCRNRKCVNPWHLEAVTRLINVRRGLAPKVAGQFNRNKTHCPRGHPYDDENTRIYQGRRQCRACDREKTKQRYWERKRTKLEQDNG